MIDRRKLLIGGSAGLLLGGCDRLNRIASFRGLLEGAEKLNLGAQRLITDRGALAREYAAGERSPVFRANGSRTADTGDYRALLTGGFVDYALIVDGLVDRPLRLPLAALDALAQRSQVTRHDCVEGWSAIGQWAGPRLGPILDAARLKPDARYIVFHCADRYGSTPYYESIDLVDAFHPQTILATRMNGMALPEAHGAPVRLRVERQLGYKHAKYVMRVEARATLAGLYGGKGGYWEDGAGYAWYAGI